VSHLEAYRNSPSEIARTNDLLRIVPKNRMSVLDIGARDGHFSKLLQAHFTEVTALDLETPKFEAPGVRKLAGDVTKLEFPDNSFDCVFCAEVLEHVPDVSKACLEIARVARHEVIIGVPYRQDIRLGRTTCENCGYFNPPWGHVNSFDEQKLARLFPSMRVVSSSFVGKSKGATNTLSVALQDFGGNPWGTYSQEEPCLGCGQRLNATPSRTVLQRIACGLGVLLNRAQQSLTSSHGNWIHLLLAKQQKHE
jgi:SAM-dependent methyltransferase